MSKMNDLATILDDLVTAANQLKMCAQDLVTATNRLRDTCETEPPEEAKPARKKPAAKNEPKTESSTETQPEAPAAEPVPAYTKEQIRGMLADLAGSGHRDEARELVSRYSGGGTQTTGPITRLQVDDPMQAIRNCFMLYESNRTIPERLNPALSHPEAVTKPPLFFLFPLPFPRPSLYDNHNTILYTGAKPMSPNDPKKENPREVYADIIDLPAWEPSPKHPRMSLHDRAAQFAPFAALVGYDEMINEEFRQTDEQLEPGEEQLNLLNQKLNVLRQAAANGEQPVVSITYFIPDERKSGGKYQTVNAAVRRVDTTNRQLILASRNHPELPEAIQIDRILAIEGGLVDNLEDF